ncbi:hypothetical protein MKW98_015646, partial [Papaver atlanticum]
MGLEIIIPKSDRAKRAIEKRAPKLIENGKKTLILKGTKTSNMLNNVMTGLYHLKRGSAIRYTRKNDNIIPFENGGETSLEFYSLKTDCILFVKRLNNLVLGRTYDHHIYDLVEVGVENFKSMKDFSYDKKLAPQVGIKPLFDFIGEGFESVEELKHLKEVLLELLRGEVVENLNLSCVDRVYVCTTTSSKIVFFTHCALRLKRLGTVFPRMELVEVGPSMNLVVRRHRLPDQGLTKQAMRKSIDPHKKKSDFEDVHGRVYIPDQE